MKHFNLKALLAVAVLSLGFSSLLLVGCSSGESDNANVPVAKPGDGGPKPSSLQQAGGAGGSEPAGGTAQKPVTE